MGRRKYKCDKQKSKQKSKQKFNRQKQTIEDMDTETETNTVQVVRTVIKNLCDSQMHENLCDNSYVTDIITTIPTNMSVDDNQVNTTKNITKIAKITEIIDGADGADGADVSELIDYELERILNGYIKIEMSSDSETILEIPLPDNFYVKLGYEMIDHHEAKMEINQGFIDVLAI